MTSAEETPGTHGPAGTSWRWAAAFAALLPAAASAYAAYRVIALFHAIAIAGSGGKRVVSLGLWEANRLPIAAGSIATVVAAILAIQLARGSMRAARFPDLPFSLAAVLLGLVPALTFWLAETFTLRVVFGGATGSVSQESTRLAFLLMATEVGGVLAGALLVVSPILLATLSPRATRLGAQRSVAVVWGVGGLLFGLMTVCLLVRSLWLHGQALSLPPR